MASNRYKAVVAGGGLVGLATVYEFLKTTPGARVLVLEKEQKPGIHQSGSNSGVLHAGLYYKPGSRKAALSVSGLKMMVEFCRENGVRHEICGKIVMAVGEDELPRLRNLHERGQANGLRDLRWLSKEEIKEREPNAGGVAAIHVPEEGIVDYPGVVEKLVERIQAMGGEVRCNARFQGLRQTADGAVVLSSAGEFETDLMIGCAGLHSDRVAREAGGKPEMKIIPFRGEYFKLRPEREHLVRHLIYPVPDPSFPFLGVHFTRLILGGIEAGPNAVLAFAREGYSWKAINLTDLAESLTFPGLWRFLAAYPKVSFYEVKRSLSKKEFCRSLQRLVPAVQVEDLVPGGAGVRAQAMFPDGKLVEDFHFLVDRRAVHVLNAPSPAATASLAIGKEIVSRIVSQFPS